MIRTWLRRWLGIEALHQQMNMLYRDLGKAPRNPFLAMEPTWPAWDQLQKLESQTRLAQIPVSPVTAPVSEPTVTAFEPHLGKQ